MKVIEVTQSATNTEKTSTNRTATTFEAFARSLKFQGFVQSLQDPCIFRFDFGHCVVTYFVKEVIL